MKIKIAKIDNSVKLIGQIAIAILTVHECSSLLFAATEHNPATTKAQTKATTSQNTRPEKVITSPLFHYPLRAYSIPSLILLKTMWSCI